MSESQWDVDEPSEEQLAELAWRAAAWRRTGGDPRALWPTLEPRAIQTAADAIGNAVATMLRDSRATLPADADSDALGVAALLSGVGPLLGHWAEQGLLDTGDAVRQVLLRHLRHARLRSTRVDAAMRPLFARLFA